MVQTSKYSHFSQSILGAGSGGNPVRRYPSFLSNWASTLSRNPSSASDMTTTVLESPVLSVAMPPTIASANLSRVFRALSTLVLHPLRPQAFRMLFVSSSFPFHAFGSLMPDSRMASATFSAWGPRVPYGLITP